tara:strand:+ start:405 stop:1151 length:747 start_codon:yes stop_codon:yes gene_type:complete
MAGMRSILVLALLCGTVLPGCISFGDASVDLDLQANHSILNGTVVESYVDGQLTSLDSVTIVVDFSETKSEIPLKRFGIEFEGGREAIEIDAKSESSISVEFSTHGLYNLTAYAIDEDSNRASSTETIRIDLQINWVEEDTNSPEKMPFNPIPDNQGVHPSYIEVISTVENPSILEDFGGGRSVDFTWKITDELDDTCQSYSEQVDDGESVTWNTIHFNTYLLHDLSVEYEEGQDSISVSHSVLIIYD